MIVDNRNAVLNALDERTIRKICDRRFGVGADGFMLLENIPGYAFKMVYYNADGRESSMCGNGGRCIAAFAKKLGISNDQGKFWAIDGEHDFKISESCGSLSVSLKMLDVLDVEKGEAYFYLNTGSPHYVVFEKEVQSLDLVTKARAIRYNDRFKTSGTNVNYAQVLTANQLFVRTYERGVEDETLSCGTGVTAAALCLAFLTEELVEKVFVHTKGGELEVSFEHDLGGQFKNVWLQGPADFVFKGELELP